MKLPAHIAIIMDGNGRWAQERNLPRREGHKQGVKTLKKIARIVGEMGISYLTVYAFSTENWKRPGPEVNFLLRLFRKTINEEIEELKSENISIKVIGRREGLPGGLVREIEDMEEDTESNNGLQLNIAFNYGGRAEIIDAAQKACHDQKLDNISEDSFKNYLYNTELPEVELLIRTGGEKRISNFLLWQIAYAELYFTEKFWPDFDKNELKQAIKDFNCRERKFGGLNKAGDEHVDQKNN